MSAKLCLTLVILNVLGFTVQAGYLTLFADYNREGDMLDLDVNKCTNLPKAFSKRTSSLNLHGKCVRLYSEPRCEGNRMEFHPGDFHLDNLSMLKFNDVAMSVNRCPANRQKVLQGKFIIQSAADGTVLTAVGDLNYQGQDAKIYGHTWKQEDSQRWTIHPFGSGLEIIKNGYELIPLEFSFNNPISYSAGGVGPEGIPYARKIIWYFHRLSNGNYMLKRGDARGKCLSNQGSWKQITYERCEPQFKSVQWKLLKETNAIFKEDYHPY